MQLVLYVLGKATGIAKQHSICCHDCV